MLKNKFSGKKIDYSSMSNLPNIDVMCDVLVNTQRDAGIPVSMFEAEYSNTGNKIRRFKRNSNGEVIDTRTGKVLDPEEDREIPVIPRMSGAKSEKSHVRMTKSASEIDCPCKKSQDIEPKENSDSENTRKRRLSLFERGFDNFYNGIFGDEDDDDNDEYVCEYCTDLGYTGKYKSYICDNCCKCEGCSEFMNGTCDGCSYSRTRTGVLYSETLGLDQIVDPEDLDIIQKGKETEHVRREFGGFSILDH